MINGVVSGEKGVILTTEVGVRNVQEGGFDYQIVYPENRPINRDGRQSYD
jgi:hypothetical protein